MGTLAKGSGVGKAARETKGWYLAHKWLLLRRFSQVLTIGLFLLGPLAGVWFIEGNLNASLILDKVPLTDPFLALQVWMSGREMESQAVIGLGIVLGFYLLVGGRVFCSWVCPINIVTDGAAWLRRFLGLPKGVGLSRNTRYWILAAVFVLPAIGGQLYWELINPVSIVHRGLIFGFGLSWVVVVMVFLFDLLVSSDGWCGRICPMGAMYSLLTPASRLRVSAVKRQQCNDCLDCFKVCPEPHVINPALKGEELGLGPNILNINCTNCGRCIDVCAPNVFEFAINFSDNSRIKL
ncbi:MAG: quinol dehydrogenase ferredoxin subunit NapH [Magnetococcales bacterium]|nr:quinol dehydrogenase ferredoxin subunit NapH [Magnetococcales bacterium]